MSKPLAHGRTTSAFERPCGFGKPSHTRAVSPVTSNGPFFCVPMNEASAHSRKRLACVKLALSAS